MRTKIYWSIALSLGLVFCVQAQSAETNRIALVIGVQNYTAVQPLRHSLNDANDMAAVLASKGFKVDLLLDPKSAKDIKNAMSRYFQAISKGTVGVIYYSGHATVHQGINYLIPADASLQNPGDLDDQCVKMDYVMASLNSTDNLNILVLDACRSNSFPSFNRDLTRGMVNVEPPKGSIVLFAAQPGKVASDGTSRNGLFTSKLLKYINEPNLDLADILKKVKQDVLTESNGDQLPSYVDNSLGGDFYFTKGEKLVANQQLDKISNTETTKKAIETDTEKAIKPGIRKLENIKGEWVISNEITPLQARERAIQEAKVEVLRRAGVPEYVAQANLLYKAEKQMHLREIFESLTTIDIAGEISEFSIIKEEKKTNETGAWVYQVWANATVSVHEIKRDPGFNFEVKGVKDSYMSPDKLTFEIKPWKDGYLTAFILGEEESNLLFPNSMEKQKKLVGGRAYQFPNSEVLDYEISSSNTMELNHLILLYTKQEIPFVIDQTADNILRFIAKIDPAEKCLKSFSLLIKK